MIFKPTNKCEIFRSPLNSNLQGIANLIEENSNSTFFWYVIPQIVNTNVTQNKYIATVIYKKKLRIGRVIIIIALIIGLLFFINLFGDVFSNFNN